MQGNKLIAAAAAPFTDLCRDLTGARIDTPTPCAEFAVRGLVNHLLFWGPSLLAAASKEAHPPPAPAESDVDLVRGEWQAALLRQSAELITAWEDPAAWDGNTVVGGPMELPGAMAGGMVLSEFVLHGWDLSRSLGRTPHWEPDVLAYTVDFLRDTAEMGRQYGAYGPEFAVPSGSSALDVALGLSGRDPNWTST